MCKFTYTHHKTRITPPTHGKDHVLIQRKQALRGDTCTNTMFCKYVANKYDYKFASMHVNTSVCGGTFSSKNPCLNRFVVNSHSRILKSFCVNSNKNE